MYISYIGSNRPNSREWLKIRFTPIYIHNLLLLNYESTGVAGDELQKPLGWREF